MELSTSWSVSSLESSMEKRVWPSIYRSWRWMCFPPHPSDQTAIKPMVQMCQGCVCLHGRWWKAVEPLGWSADLGGRLTPSLVSGATSFGGDILASSWVGKCRLDHLVTSVCSFVGHPIHVLWSWVTQRKHTLHPRARNAWECVSWI